MPPIPATKPRAVRDLRGPKTDVLAKLDTDYDLTPELKTYLAAKVAASPHAGVIVHAHEQTESGNWHVVISLTKLFLAIFCLLLGAGNLPATLTSSNLVTYAASGGASTNTGTPVLIGTAYVANAPSFIISDGGTLTTNALLVDVQYGLDTNNFTTLATYTKSSTNATDGVITPGILAVRIYARTRVVTTNNINVGTKAVFTQ